MILFIISSRDLCIGKNFPNILRLGRHILMCIYIRIEDLVANALSELTEHKNQRQVLFKDLDRYGAKVIKVLNQEGEQAVLILSKKILVEEEG